VEDDAQACSGVALWVSAIFAAVPLAAAFRVFRRRDVTGE
jgi:hypothetical protein